MKTYKRISFAVVRLGLLLCLIVVLNLGSSLQASERGQVLLKKSFIVKVEKLRTHEEKKLGLGNRNSLQKGTGMLFIYRRAGKHSFWMKRMRFAIDIIWSYQGRVVQIEEAVPPPPSIMTPDGQLVTYGTEVISDTVLEVPARFSSQIGLRVGDSFQIIK
jgi:uncharacterized membrane protein (UPF0127 family)